MKKLILPILLALPFLVNAQSNSSIDLVLGLGYSYRAITNKDVAPTMTQFDGESGKLTYNYGINYNRRLNTKIWLKTGLRMTYIGYKGKKEDDIRWGSEHDGNGGWAGPDPNLFHESQLIFDHVFAGIPLMVRYEFTEKKITPFAEIGIEPNIYLHTKTKRITDLESYNSSTKSIDSSINRFNIFANFSFGFNYQLNPTWTIVTQPIFRYQLNSLIDAPVKKHLFAAGLEIGLRWNIPESPSD